MSLVVGAVPALEMGNSVPDSVAESPSPAVSVPNDPPSLARMLGDAGSSHC